MTFSTFASPGVGLQGGGGSGGGTASLPISGDGATITTSTPLINGTQTWNSGATTFTSLLLNVTDTASAAGSLLMDLQVGGSSRFNVGKTGSLKLGVSPTGTNQAGTNVIIAGSQGTGTGAGGSIIFQVAPAGSSGTAQNALATFLEATSARAFNLYNTTDVTTNFERGKIAWESNVLRIGTEKAGTGTARALEFQTDGTTRLTIGTTGVVTIASVVSNPFQVISSTSGFYGPLIQNTGSATTSSAGFTVQNNQTSQLFARVYSSGVTASVWGITLGSYSAVFSDGASSEGLLIGTLTADPIIFGTDTSEKMRITSAGLLTFQGTTSSFPALKRSSASLQVRLADDTGYTTIDANHRLQGTAPAANNSTGTAGDIRYDADYIYICTATNTWKRVAIATWP